MSTETIDPGDTVVPESADVPRAAETTATLPPAFDVAAVRARFSALTDDGFTYFDAPAGSQVPDEVGDAIARQMREGSGNIGGYYPLSDELSALVDAARERTAAFLGGDAANIVLGGSMTTVNFALTRAAARGFSAGDEIIVTRLDHEGSVAPWNELAIDRGFVVKVANLTDDLLIDLDHLRSLVTDRTRVIAFPLAANTVGSIAQAREIADIAHSVGAISWVDAVHYAAHRAIDARAIRADVILCSAYKFCGPHLGMAHVEPGVANEWRAYKVAARALDPLGARFETGTLPYEQLAGLIATYDYLDSIGGFAAIAPYEEMLAAHLLATLPPEVRVLGPALVDRVPTFLLTINGLSAESIARSLAERDIGVWKHTFAYEVGMPEALPEGADPIRVGIAHYNTVEEIDRLAAALAEIAAARL
ncbi:aminotransferase class V-fold PLP-dependent enzyme [Marisediminicola senii]|uniref:aminotransferase class V-fold PLP-dependent enzyme n=1 Tax=Marisediminicola senii TaxID=2711233 RepID=UPI0013EA6561|nr:aminotransferase class V-fold PLP-dependent enzyme [Marisediminicola senii]